MNFCSKVGIGLFFAVFSGMVHATGFGLYEASARTHALGGAVMGRAVDAAGNFFNPATLTDLPGVTLTAGFVTEHPRARMKVNDGRSSTMDPGVFCLPHVHTSVSFLDDFAFGLGVMPEYGLGSDYCDDWELNWNSLDTTVLSFTVNPNLAWRVTENWSVGAGLRLLYFDFEQHSRPYAANGGMDYGRMNNRLKGDNDMEDFGWQAGTKYDLNESFSVGFTYKSKTVVRVRGVSETDVRSYRYAASAAGVAAADAIARAIDGPARTKLVLPQSVTGGFNWDIASGWHLGAAVGWTQWSSVGTLDFDLNGVHKPIRLCWEDTWRFAIAPSWDFAEGWTAMCSYVYETDCCNRQQSTMLPPTRRHMVTAGLAWQVMENLEIACSYGMILMDGGVSRLSDPLGDRYRYEAHRGLSHAVGLSLTYRF